MVTGKIITIILLLLIAFHLLLWSYLRRRIAVAKAEEAIKAGTEKEKDNG